MLSGDERILAADRLWQAERDREPIPPLTESYEDIDAVDAYEIQLHNIRRRMADAPVVGHKVGLSSPAMQQMMGVDEPDYGHLLADMRLHEDVPVEPSRYCYPRVEVEVAFLLGADLPGEDCTEADVLARTEALAPAIELIDSRIVDWRIKLADTIADNASSAGFVLGAARIAPDEVDARDIDVVLRRAGDGPGAGAPPDIADIVQSGRSDAVLGNPATAVAWLARKVAGFGVRLRAGHIVLPGSCTRAVDVAAGQTFRADFRASGVEFGAVSLSFGSAARPGAGVPQDRPGAGVPQDKEGGQ